MTGSELQPLAPENKEQKTKSQGGTPEHVDPIKNNLINSGVDKNDAEHDAKIIASKYKEVNTPEDIQQFASIRTELGEAFFDHMLYNANIPYSEIQSLAKALKENKTYREKAIDVHKQNTKGLLETMQTPPDSLKNRIHLVSRFDKEGVTTQADKNEQFFVDRQQKIAEHIGSVMKINNVTVTPAVRGRLSVGIMDWWYEKVQQSINTTNTGKSTDEKMHTDQIRKLVAGSPFENTARQQIGVSVDPEQLLKNIATAQDQNGNSITDLSTVNELMQAEKLQTLLSDPKNYEPNASLMLHTATEAYTGLDEQGVQNLNTRLQTVLNMYENGRPTTKTERLVEGMTPMLNQIGKGLSTAADAIGKFVDNLKKTGVWEQIEKVWDLVFGRGDFLDRLSAFNTLKESKLSLEKTAVVTQGTELLKELPKETDPEDKELPDHAKVVHHMHQTIFASSAFDYTDTNGEWNFGVKQTALGLGKGVYEKLLVGEPKANDMIDVAMRTMCGEKDKAIYENFVSCRKDNRSAEAQKLFQAKLETAGTELLESIKKEGKTFGKNPNETFAKALLTKMVDTPNAALGVAHAATNETQKGIDEVKEITEQTTIEVKDNKMFLSGLPEGKAFGIQGIDKDITHIKSYDPKIGVELGVLGTPPKFTLVEQKKNADDTVTRGPVPTLENVPLAAGAPKVEKYDQETGITLDNIASGDYIAAVSYEVNGKKETINQNISVPTHESKVTPQINKEKGMPTQMHIQSKKGGLWQTVRKNQPESGTKI